jgi:hypothetical protein
LSRARPKRSISLLTCARTSGDISRTRLTLSRKTDVSYVIGASLRATFPSSTICSSTMARISSTSLGVVKKPLIHSHKRVASAKVSMTSMTRMPVRPMPVRPCRPPWEESRASTSLARKRRFSATVAVTMHHSHDSSLPWITPIHRSCGCSGHSDSLIKASDNGL